MHEHLRHLRPGVLGPFVLGLLALVVAAGLGTGAPATQSIAFPLPSPTYSIVGHSGAHQISLLNLPVPYVGLPQVPIPVDVDGNLLPDVLVALNLINVPEGLLHNPPNLNDLIAPNLEINRLLTAPILGQSSPPLRLEVRYRISDLEGGPETVIQAGYDTGPGGSIPTYWKAILGGLSDMFNPLTVRLDTRPPLPNQYQQPTYRGPLSIVGQIELEDSMEMDFDLHYDPLPDDILVSLATDDLGTHVLYNHSAPRDVDVNTTIHQDSADGSKLDVQARIDRMPNNIAVDFASGEGVGDIDFAADIEGRAPDVGATVVSTPAPGSDDKPLVLRADIEGLPDELHANWELPAEGQMSFDFNTPGSGVGAIQAEVRDYFGADPAAFTFVPTEQQFASYHKEGDQSLIRARVERIRSVSFDQIADGIDASMQIGDGQLPLEVKVVHDDFDSEGTFMDAHATVSPLPSELNFSMRTPEPGSTGEPLTVHYDTGESGETADIDAEVRIVEPETTPTACGDPGVICAELDVRHLPEVIDATIVNVSPLDTRIAVDLEPRPGGAEPDIFASAVIAQKPEPPDPGDPPAPPPDPIVAEVSLYGVPEHLRVRMLNRTIDDGMTTEREALERAEFHACSWDFEASTPGCTDAEGRIDAIDFSFRNFLGANDLPVLLPTTPLWVTVVGRGGDEPTDSVRLEAKAHFTDIAEVQLLTNDDVLGVRTDVGGNQDLSALLDVENLPVVFEEATGSDPAVYHRLDLEASATIEPLPQHLDFCFQQKDRDIVDPPDAPFTAACQNPDPFGDDDGVGDAERSPLALAYEGTDAAGTLQQFDVHTTIDLNERGDADTGPDVVADDQHVRGHVNVDHLPGSLTAFVDSPPDDADGNPTDGPLRVEYHTETPLDGDQIVVDFAVEVTDADFLCRDPRPMPLGKKALCAKAVISNLPTELSLFYDPNQAADNFILDTSGEQQIDIDGLEASLVEGKLVDKNDPPTPNDEGDDTLVTSVLVAFGYIHGLPNDITGTLLLPGTVDLTASPPIDTVELTVQNFIGPDPLPRDVPDQRIGVPGPAVPEQRFTVFQRDEFFRAFAHVTNLRGLAFAKTRDADNPDKLLDTTTIRAAFGEPGDTLRAYADMQSFSEHDAMGVPDPTSLVSIIGDVTMQHVPDEVYLCIRGSKTIAGDPLEPSYCDLAPGTDDSMGAFSFVGDPGNPAAPKLDIYAFVRFAQAGGTDVLAARVDLVDIPHVVQGTFNTSEDARVEFSSFNDIDTDGFGVDPQGIGSIEFDLADFDIDSHGYDPADPLPWGATSKDGTVTEFPAPPATQHLRLHANPQDMHVRGEVHDLQSVLFAADACAAPSDPAPDSYPYYPDKDLGNEYTCIRAQFENDANEELDIHVELDKSDGERMVLRDAGLTRIPNLLQATIASAATLNPDTSLRAPCPDITPDPGAIDCMPPMLRLDTSGDATLFGSLEMGQGSDLATVRDIDANATLADLDASPRDNGGPTAWTDWGPDRTGARVRVVQYATGNDDEPNGSDDNRTAITAGLRIAVPESLTIDQFQTWNGATDAGSGHINEASDLRFRYVVREDSGGAAGGPDQVVSTIGELAALLHTDDGGQQVLASGTNEARGLPIPGELGLTMFMRHLVIPEGTGCDDCHDIMFMQLQGRISASISARLRILGGADASIENIGANVLNLPSTQGMTSDTDPSFALRVEMDKKVGPPGMSDLEEALLCIVYCVQTQIGLESLDADFNFKPTSADASRRVDAYIVMDGAANAAEIRGFDTWDSTSNQGNQKFSANLRIALNPLIIFLHIGLNPILGLDLFLGGEMRIEAVVDAAEEFRLNNKMLHLKVAQERGGPDTVVNTDLHIYGLAAASFLWLFFIPPIPLYVATFVPPSLPPPVPPPVGAAIIGWRPCPSPIPFFFNEIPLDAGNDSEDVTAWIDDPRFIRFGLLVPLVDLLVPVIFCAIGADLPLIEDNPGHPIYPFDLAPTHPVGGLSGPPPAPVAPPPPPAKPRLVVSSGQTLALCGRPQISEVVVEPGGTIVVANALDNSPIPFEPPGPDESAPPSQPRCPDPDSNGENFGWLELNAGDSIDISGTIEGPPVGSGNGRLMITANEILVDDNGGDPDGLVQAGTGPVTLQSSGPITIEGDVLADELIPAVQASTPPTGGGGAGHGGAGGNGSNSGGTGGGAYGDVDFVPVEDPDNMEPFPTNLGQVPLETGAAGGDGGGAAGAGGDGGGTLYIQGAEVTVTPGGTVSAIGGSGADVHALNEHCAVNVHYPDDPDEAADTEHTDPFPNTGLYGSGGGSGGAIFIGGTKVFLDGTVTVAGGAGGAGIRGGGGGGAGGILKISAALYDGTPDVAGGAGGSSACPPNPPPGFFPTDGFGIAADSVADGSARPEFADGGEGGELDPHPALLGPHSSATPVANFFNRAEPGAPLSVPYVAAAELLGGSTSNEVVLCGLHRPPESFRIDDSGDDPADDKDPNDVDMATGSSVLQPCGNAVPDDDPNNDSPTSLHQLDSAVISGTEAADDAAFSVELDNGYWAVYTMILRNATGDPANSCLNHGDFLFFGNGALYDQLNCAVEPLPDHPDSVGDVGFGVDNADPSITIAAPATSQGVTVPVVIAEAKDEMDIVDGAYSEDPLQNFSGVLTIECGTNLVDWTPCGVGTHPVSFSNANGSQQAHVRITDVAGNQFIASAPVEVDSIAPESSAAPVPIPGQPVNTWYQTAPDIEISGYDDFGGSGVPDDGVQYEWWIDGGAPTPCAVGPTCTVDLDLTTGRHTFHWRAIDRAGNREDGEAAENTIEINVDDADPLVQLLAVPEPENGDNGWYQVRPFVVLSAIDQPGASGLSGFGAGVFYGIDDPTAPLPYTGFFTVPPGAHTVYFKARDVAGNETLIGTLPTCDDPKVNDADPEPSCRSFLVDDAAPVAVIDNVGPNGANGWHVSNVPVEIDVSDDTPGSGINAAVSPSGTFISVDGAPVQPYTGPITMGEGLHSIVAYTVDVSGQRSEIVRREYFVDRSRPVSNHRATPPLPARNNWWRSLPTNVLRATDGDQNAGVDSIVFRRNGGSFDPYTTPFSVNPGSTTLEWRALDRSGVTNHEPVRSRVLRADPSPPTVEALNGPLLYIRSHLLHILLGIPLDAPLNWRISDSVSGRVTVQIQIYNVLGQMVRTIEHGTVNVTPGVPLTGSTAWDGRDMTLTGFLPAGVYYYRVIATDDAGNVAQSGESKPITITIRLL